MEEVGAGDTESKTMPVIFWETRGDACRCIETGMWGPLSHFRGGPVDAHKLDNCALGNNKPSTEK